MCFEEPCLFFEGVTGTHAPDFLSVIMGRRLLETVQAERMAPGAITAVVDRE